MLPTIWREITKWIIKIVTLITIYFTTLDGSLQVPIDLNFLDGRILNSSFVWWDQLAPQSLPYVLFLIWILRLGLSGILMLLGGDHLRKLKLL